MIYRTDIGRRVSLKLNQHDGVIGQEKQLTEVMAFDGMILWKIKNDYRKKH